MFSTKPFPTLHLLLIPIHRQTSQKLSAIESSLTHLLDAPQLTISFPSSHSTDIVSLKVTITFMLPNYVQNILQYSTLILPPSTLLFLASLNHPLLAFLLS